MKKLYIAGIIYFFPVALLIAQSAELQQFYTQKYYAQQQGDLNKAREWGEKAVRQAEKEFGKAGLYANYAFDLATLYTQLNEFGQAEKLYLECLQIYEKEYGKDHEYTGTGYLNLGVVYHQQQKFNEAETHYLKAKNIYLKLPKINPQYIRQTDQLLLSVYQQTSNFPKLIPFTEQQLAGMDKNSEDYAITLQNLAYFHQQNGDYESSEKIYQQALLNYERIKGKENDTYAEISSNQGMMFIDSRRFEDAQKIFEANLKYYEKTKGKLIYDYARTLNNLAFAREKLMKTEEAEKCYLETLDIYKKINYSDSLVNAYALMNLAGLYAEKGQFKESEKNYRQANAIIEKGFGKTHPQYLAGANNLANVLSEQDRFEDAEKLLLESLQTKEKVYGNNHYEYAASLMSLGNLYQKKGEYIKAEKYYLEGVVIIEKIKGKETTEFASALNQAAYNYRLQGKFNLAEELTTRALQIIREKTGEQSLEYASQIHTIGLLYDAMGLHQKAGPLLQGCEKIRKKILGEQHPDYAIILNDLGLHYQQTGQFSKAGPLFEKSVQIKAKVFGKNHSSYATGMNNLGIFYYDQGEYGLAELFYKEALRIYEKSYGKKHPYYANTLANLGRMYFEYLQYSKAAIALNEAYGIQAEVLGEKHPGTLNTLNFMGLLLNQIGQYQEAEQYLFKCLTLRAEVLGKNHPDYLDVLINLGDMNRFTGKYQEAEKYYLEALHTASTTLGKDNLLYGIYLNNLALMYADQKLYAKTKPLLEEVYRIRKKIYAADHPEMIGIQTTLAEIYFYLGQYPQAEELYRQTNQMRLKQIQKIFPYLSERERETFVESAKADFNSFALFVYHQGKQHPRLLSDLMDLQLAIKGLLLNTLNEERRAVVNSQDKELLQWFEQLKENKERLAKIYKLNETERTKQQIDVEALEKATEELEKKINVKVRVSRSQVTWNEVKQTLQANELLMEVVQVILDRNEQRDSTAYLVLALNRETKNYPEAVWLSNGSDLDVRYFKYYRNAIKNRSEDKFSFEQYWQNIAKHISYLTDNSEKNKKIYFSPDGIFHQVNLNTLKNPDTQRFLIEEYDIRLLSNSKDLALFRSKNRENTPTRGNKAELYGFPNYDSYNYGEHLTYEKKDAFVQAVADTTSRFLNVASIADLPGTKNEVENIQKILAENNYEVKLHLREKATEERIKSSPDIHILHIATHGFFMPFKEIKDPDFNFATKPLLRSGLLLCGAKNAFQEQKEEKNTDPNREDGILTAYEAMNLNLSNTELVVLSACETGVGEIENGEGVYGLQRAFVVAGAKAIVMSLWTVSDEATQELMVNFYTQWMKNRDKKEAFRKAQLQLREKYPHPYFWGAFVMVGE